MEFRRQHGRIIDELPPEIKEQVNRLLIEGGNTYDDIRAFLDDAGYDISRSAIGRYGKGFMAFYQRMKIVEDKARTLQSEPGDGMVLEEAVSKAFTQMILEAQISGELNIKKAPRIISDFAKLQKSVVDREKLKQDIAEKVRKQTLEAAAKTAGASAKRAGVSAETIKTIRRDVLRMAE